MTDYSKDTGDRLVEHYARLKMEKTHLNIEAARASIDCAGDKFNALLGRFSEEDVKKGYTPQYVYLRALNLADIATDEEKAEWEALVGGLEESSNALDEAVPAPGPAEESPLAPPEEYDNDLPPASWDVDKPKEKEHQGLLEDLHELQQLKATAAEIKDKIEAVQERALERQRTFGRPIALINPVTRAPEIAGIRQSETLVVPAPALLKALVDYYGDEDQAEAIWFGVLKPREVDTKQDGLFHQAVAAHSDEVNGIPKEVVAQVATFKPNAAYIGFTKPTARKG